MINTEKKFNVVVSNLVKSFDNRTILSDISFSIPNHSSICVLGPSGSGKSLLVKCIFGLTLADYGSSVKFNETEVAHLKISERPVNEICVGFAFQSNALFDSLKIWENVIFGKLCTGKFSIDELKKTAESYLSMVELSPNILEMYPNELSGGMQKRVSIARALASGSNILILDEPTSGLDPSTAKSIANLVKRIYNKQKSISIISITHDPNFTITVANKILLIGNGTIKESLSLKEAMKSKNEFLQDFFTTAKSEE